MNKGVLRKQIAKLILFMFMFTFVPVGAANATDYTTSVIYNALFFPTLSPGDTVTTSNDSEGGVYIDDGRQGIAINSVDITTAGKHSAGVSLSWLSSATVTSSDINTSGFNAYGVTAYNFSSADIMDTKITTKDAKGVEILADSHTTITGATISASGSHSYGVEANTRSTADIRNTTINTSGDLAYGVYATDHSNADIRNTTITTRGEHGHGVIAERSSSVDIKDTKITTSDAYAFGVNVKNDTRATLTNTTITTNLNWGYGAVAELGSSMDIIGGSITTNGTNGGYALFVENNADITADGTDITVNGNADVFRLTSGTNSITVKNIAPVNPAGLLLDSFGGSNTFTAENSTLKGEITHYDSDYGNLSVNLVNTTLTGQMLSDNRLMPINMNIDGDSRWNVTKVSGLHGVLNNSGTINFGSNVADGAKKVYVSDYNGIGSKSKLFMKTDINTAAEMDQILASNLARGTSDITIYNTANAGAEKSAPLLRGANGGGSQLTLSNWDEIENGVKYLHAGAWRYSLVKETDATGAEEWVLKRGDLIPPTPPTPDPDPSPDPEPEPLRPIGLTTTGQAIVAAAFLHDVWYTETNTWNKRMGIYRDNLWNGGLWFTGVANRQDFDHEHDNTVADRQDFTTGTIGFDKKYEMKDGNFWGGVMAGYGKADSDLLAGIGDVDMDSYHMSLYGVYRSNNGFYVNGIVKYNDYRSKLDILRPDNFSKYVLNFDQIHGEWSQDGLGISLQAGKRFDFKGDKGWYWEPQMQFSWNRVFASDYTTDSGIDVEVDDMDYIRLRGGIVLGRSWTLKNGTLLDLYADASIIHDFDADVDVTMSGGTYTSTLGGTWGIYGVGANWQFKPGQFFHARFQYSDGEPFTEPFAVYLGFSFEM